LNKRRLGAGIVCLLMLIGVLCAPPLGAQQSPQPPAPSGPPVPPAQPGRPMGPVAPQGSQAQPAAPGPAQTIVRPQSGAAAQPGQAPRGGQAASPANLIQMNFDNIELRDLIRFISTIMGKNFVFDETVVKGKVTILSPKNLAKDEVYRVFTTVMNYYGFSVVPSAEAVRVVRGADVKGMANEHLSNEKLEAMAPEDRFVTYVYHLDYLDPNIMVGVLRPMLSKDAYIVGLAATGSLIMIDTASNVQRIRSVLTEIDIPVSKQLGSIKIYDVQHTNAVDLAKTLQALLAEGKKAQTPKEKIFVTSYAATNSLLISAPPEDMKEIERIIADIDTLRPQVLVEAAIIEITTAKGEEFGVEWLTGVKTGSDQGVAGGFIKSDGSLTGIMTGILNQKPETVAGALQTGLNIGVIGGTINFNGASYPGVGAFIKALSTRDNVNILSTPQLLTVNNEEAEIVVGENRPYLTSSRLDVSGNPTYSYDYRDVGVKLKIKPYINKDGYVNLNLYQEVSQVTEATTGGTGSVPAPTTLKRSTKTTVVVRDSQTVVISGLIKDNSTGTQQGIPFLSSIPLFGYLFGYKKTTSEKTNLLVFLTPRIIYNSESLESISRDKKESQDKIIKGQKLLQDKK
jgi:general secretion pathway protein D